MGVGDGVGVAVGLGVGVGVAVGAGVGLGVAVGGGVGVAVGDGVGVGSLVLHAAMTAKAASTAMRGAATPSRRIGSADMPRV